MAVAEKMSPLRAILICVNSMIGAGLFINTKPLTNLAGSCGFLGYVIAAVILVPLILCIAELAALHPVAGGLYVYSRTHVGSWAGFFSSWAYFVGKTTSVAILMHKFIEYFYVRVNILQSVPLFALDCLMLFVLVFLNSAGIAVGGRVQYLFSTLKAIPIFFAFGLGFAYFNVSNFGDICGLQDILCTVPIAIFPLLGFEVICSIGNMIEDSARNIKRVIITSFVVVAIIDVTFQLTTFGILGYELGNANEPILALGMKALSSYPILASTINGAVFASIIGACFSIMTSNCWNLHTIARNGHLPGGNFLMRINRNNVPWVSLSIEALLGCVVLFISVDQVPLQNMAVFAQIVSYFITALAAWYAVQSGALKKLSSLMPFFAVGSCAFIMGICLQRIITFGVSLPFLLLFITGIAAALYKRFVCAH